nr:MAG TPA: hypothetical protein [Caudoviricetes sp.]
MPRMALIKSIAFHQIPYLILILKQSFRPNNNALH